jgi:hypothetical protein
MSEYLKFARGVGLRITFNKRMKELAYYYDVSIYHMGPIVEKWFIEGVRHSQRIPEDPLDCLLKYIELLEGEYEDLSPEGIIAQHIRPTPKKSFCRFGDRNHMSGSIKKNYIHEDGTPLDTQAQNLSLQFDRSHGGREFSPQDLVDFILSYPKGPKSYVSEHEQMLSELSDHYYEVTGSYLNPEYAELFCKEFLTNELEEKKENAPF